MAESDVCCVLQCPLSEPSRSMRSVCFFAFPHPSDPRYPVWIERTRRAKDWTPSAASKICSRHFRSSDILTVPSAEDCEKTERRLKHDALPSLFEGIPRSLQPPVGSVPRPDSPEIGSNSLPARVDPPRESRSRPGGSIIGSSISGGIVPIQDGTEENPSADSPGSVSVYSNGYGVMLCESDDSSESSGSASTTSSDPSTRTSALQEDDFHHAVNTPTTTDSATPNLHPRPTANSATRRKTAHRNHFRKGQLQQLEAFFQKCRYPSHTQRLELADIIDAGEDDKRIQVWFKNRRSKEQRIAGTTPDVPVKRPCQPAKSVSLRPIQPSFAKMSISPPAWTPPAMEMPNAVMAFYVPSPGVVHFNWPGGSLTMPDGSSYRISDVVQQEVAGLLPDLQKPLDCPASFVPLPFTLSYSSFTPPPVQMPVMEGNDWYSPPEDTTLLTLPETAEQSPANIPPSESDLLSALVRVAGLTN